MFAEDLLRDLRRAGFGPAAIARYVRAISARAAGRLPRHAELVRSVAATALVLFAVEFGAALYLSATFGRDFGVSFLIGGSALLLVACFWILLHVGLMHGPREEAPLRRLPLPVALTMLRLVSIPAIVLLLEAERWNVAVWVFVASALTDVMDGVLARAFAMESSAGKVLDPLVDIAFNATVYVTLARVGVLPWWVSGLLLGRYALLVFGTFALYIFSGPVRIEPTAFGKLTGVLTTSLVGLLLLGLASWNDVTRHQLKPVFDVGLGVLAIATIIQVVFIGLANRKAHDAPEVELVRPPAQGKVVGEIRGPRG
ncbi:MAG TPA: CDP-alcohol phosphatidyltransferase family protein [Candidatus Eisenbacteria bacterium]